MKSAVFLLAAFLLAQAPAHGQTASAAPALSERDFPVFMADLPNPNDFSLFANGGWDGNWYVGFNTCWVQKLPAPPPGAYRKAFLGARLGRMKNFHAPGRPPWEKSVYPGKIYMAISSTASWSRKQSYFLADTADIPLEPDAENALEGTGESRWFWTEVPLKLVNFAGENFLALWSPSQGLDSVSSAPVLAAGWGTKEVDSWVSHEARGIPPPPAKALATPVTIFEPAIALKLIPASAPAAAPRVTIKKIEEGKPLRKEPAPKVVWSTIEGDSIESAWVEISTDARSWSRAGRALWNAPYVFTLKAGEIPIGGSGKSWLRVGAADANANEGWSAPVNLFEPR